MKKNTLNSMVEMLKGGPGSGQKGHQTPHTHSATMTVEHEGKKYPLKADFTPKAGQGHTQALNAQIDQIKAKYPKAKILANGLTITAIKKSNSPYYVGLVVYNPMANCILLGKRREDGLWTGPGGSAEPGESPSQAAIREAFEEANLKINESMLKELPSIQAQNGKMIHCFLVTMMPNGTHAGNDPDKEVKNWIWHPINDQLPGKTDDNRMKTISNARMIISGLKKSESKEPEFTKDQLKEMVKEHKRLVGRMKSPSKKDDAEELKIQEKELAGYKKDLKKSQITDITEVLKGGDRNDQYNQAGNARRKNRNAGQVDESGTGKNHNVKPWTTTGSSNSDAHLANEAKKRKKETIASTKHLTGEEARKYHESKQKKEGEGSRGGHVVGHTKSGNPIYSNSGIKKALMENPMTGTDINTSEFSQDDMAADPMWVEHIQNVFQDMQIGETPRIVNLDTPFEFTGMKVDHGIYSGFVKNMDEQSADYGMVISKISKMTAPQLIQALKAKEYIGRQKSEDSPAEQLADAQSMDVVETIAELPIPQDQKFEAVEQLVEEHKEEFNEGSSDTAGIHIHGGNVTINIIKKSQVSEITDILKGGPGSGKRGHKTIDRDKAIREAQMNYRLDLVEHHKKEQKKERRAAIARMTPEEKDAKIKENDEKLRITRKPNIGT